MMIIKEKKLDIVGIMEVEVGKMLMGMIRSKAKVERRGGRE